MEFENDQANQNCHGKNFYSKEDAAVSTQTVNESTDPLGVSFSTRHGDVSNKDESATLSQSLLNKDHCEQNMSVKGNEVQEEKDFEE